MDDKLALELAINRIERAKFGRWSDHSEEFRNFCVEVAKIDIAFLRSKGFRQVEVAKIPADMSIHEANPNGLFTEVK
jgi:hypothetical protein